MNRKGLWGKGMTHKGCIGKCKKWELLQFIRHALWVFFCICNLYNVKVYFFDLFLKQREPHQVVKLHRVVLTRIVGVQSVDMVGERCKKELVGKMEKWRSREKV